MSVSVYGTGDVFSQLIRQTDSIHSDETPRDLYFIIK